jgi:hypothetical protein
MPNVGDHGNEAFGKFSAHVADGTAPPSAAGGDHPVDQISGPRTGSITLGLPGPPSRYPSGAVRGVLIHKIDRSARNLKDWADLGELIDRGVEVRCLH